tara:strand:+ start:171 stop:542 length:372 start_codon:yes stop_codon:yes gene_type:complete
MLEKNIAQKILFHNKTGFSIQLITSILPSLTQEILTKRIKPNAELIKRSIQELKDHFICLPQQICDAQNKFNLECDNDSYGDALSGFDELDEFYISCYDEVINEVDFEKVINCIVKIILSEIK